MTRSRTATGAIMARGARAGTMWEATSGRRLFSRVRSLPFLFGTLLFLAFLPLLLHADDTRGQGVIAAPDGKTAVGEQYLFAIAINRYQHWNPIPGPVPEAEKLVDVLTTQYAFSPERTVFLKDAAATKAAIARQFAAYQQALKPEDSLLVLYCGHGDLDPASGTGSWIPVDGGLDRFEQEKWLPNSVLRGYLQNIPARHILVVADSCFSGQLLDSSRARPEDITDEYYRRAYQRMARQVLTSGGVETVADASAFGEALYNELLANREPWIDPAKLFVNVRAAVTGQQPLLGALKSSGHQDGGSFIFFRREVAVAPSAEPILEAGPALQDTGAIELACRLPGTLSVDGKAVGKVEAGRQYTLRDIAVGNHTLRIEGPGTEWSAKAVVLRDQTVRVEAQAPPKPAGPAAGSPWTVPGLGMELVSIGPGSFTMGSPADEPGRDDDETQHRVTLSRGYWLGKYELTQGQWRELMGTSVQDQVRKALADDTEYLIYGKKQTLRDSWGLARDADPMQRIGNLADDLPMVFVSWPDAAAFCAKLTERERRAGRLPTGYEYRLPTEAEWEYACRAGTATALYSGPITIRGENNAPELDKIAWYGGNSSVGYSGRGWDTQNYKEKQYPGGRAGYREVGTKAPNDWGLCDMLGNVFEWCHDWYGGYPASPVMDPKGPPEGSRRVYRGGSSGDFARRCRAAYRSRSAPAFASVYLGFRVALAPAVQR